MVSRLLLMAWQGGGLERRSGNHSPRTSPRPCVVLEGVMENQVALIDRNHMATSSGGSGGELGSRLGCTPTHLMRS